MVLMRRSSRSVTGLLLLGLAGCGGERKDAETAIIRADRMVTALRDRAAKVLPEETKALVDSLQAAQARAAARDYRAARATAVGVAGKAIEIANSLAGKSTEFSSAFMAFSAELPQSVERIRHRLSQLPAGSRLPPGLDRAKLEAIKADVPNWSETWKSAVVDFNNGNLGAAIAKATALKQKVTEANTLLGLAAQR